MKIAVIGTFLFDTIFSHRGTKIESLGGISYTVSILANLLPDDDEIYPIANVGADGYEKIISYLSQYKNIRTTSINKVDSKNTRVTLKYYDKESRDEFLQNLLPPITTENVIKVGKVDVILINFITGFELSTETCNHIVFQSNALTYMDYHSLCLGMNEQGKRFTRKPNNWEKWFHGVDILQMNENEAFILSDNGDPFNFGNKIVNQGIKVFNLTLGIKGSMLFAKQHDKIIYREIPADTSQHAIDVTGCGDAFSAGFIVEYMKNKNVIAAAQNANRIAGFNATLSGIEQIDSLAKFKN